MSKIVYLFGAGASANALPIVNQMPKRIDEIITKIETGKIDHPKAQASDEVKKDIIAQFKWLKQGCEKHATVDTYAKKLYVTKRDEYHRLKYVLSAYLTLEQAINQPDMRYDTFFASLFGENIADLPSDLSILSWNYDCQFELAYNEYANKGLNDIWQALNISSKKKDTKTDKSKFSITKLNGTALMEIDGHTLLDPFFGFRLNSGYIDTIHNYYLRIDESSNITNHLSFAWDNDSNNGFYNNLSPKIADAEILVVIGYSFPFFNRLKDKAIFSAMPKLKKIYIQSKDVDEVEQSMKSAFSQFQLAHPSLNKHIIKLPNVDQFYLPAEL